MDAAERELRALVAAAPADPERFRAACQEATDWRALTAAAERHGLAGVVLAEARRAGAALPGEARQLLEHRLALWRPFLERHHAFLAEAVAALGAAGVRAVALKGTVLGERLYGDIGLRPTTDIDLLVTEAECDRAVAALRGAGWQWEDGPTERYFRRREHHLHLRRPQAPELELHFRALSGFGVTVPSEDLVARARPVQLGALSTWVLCPEDELVYLAVHAAGHLLQRLGWLHDLKLLLLQGAPIAWDELRPRASAFGTSRALRFSLAAARALGAAVPNEVVGRPGVLDRLAERVRRTTLGRSRPSAGFTAGALLFHALLCDRAGAAAGHLVRGFGRIARRRARRYLPRLAPAEWAG